MCSLTAWRPTPDSPSWPHPLHTKGTIPVTTGFRGISLESQRPLTAIRANAFTGLITVVGTFAL